MFKKMLYATLAKILRVVLGIILTKGKDLAEEEIKKIEEKASEGEGPDDADYR